MSNHEIREYADKISQMDLSNLPSEEVVEYIKVISKLHENLKYSSDYQNILEKKHKLDNNYYYDNKEYYKYKLGIKKQDPPFNELFKKNASIETYEINLKNIEEKYQKIQSEYNKIITLINSFKNKTDENIIIELSKLKDLEIKEIEIVKDVKNIKKIVSSYLDSQKKKPSKTSEVKKRKGIDLITSLTRIN